MTDSLALPEAFIQHNLAAFGEVGASWLQRLPEILATLVQRWDLVLGPPFPLSYNYVAPVQRADGSAAVLKVGTPNEELRQEMLALRRYAGDGICRLLQADEDRYAMLLERVLPGETLVSLARTADEAATRVAARIMRRLWRPVSLDEGFLPIGVWFENAFRRHRAEYGGAGPFPADVFLRAEALARELLDATAAPVLLHGDLHHDNILSAERSPWLAIDPKGVTGDSGFDVGQFLLNPDFGGAQVRRPILCRRLAVFAEELNEDRRRLRDWAFVENVLSACWSAEDGGAGWRTAITAAETLLTC